MTKIGQIVKRCNKGFVPNFCYKESKWIYWQWNEDFKALAKNKNEEAKAASGAMGSKELKFVIEENKRNIDFIFTHKN